MFELPWPQDVVEELSVIKAVIIWTVTLCVVRRGDYSHLVTIDGIRAEKVFHFIGHLNRKLTLALYLNVFNRCICNLAYNCQQIKLWFEE